MDEKVIYLVTGVRTLDDKILQTRCFIWYEKYSDAEAHINECWVDQPGYFNYIVIERSTGCDSMPEDLTWFVFNPETEEYIEIMTPDCFKDSMGFTIG